MNTYNYDYKVKSVDKERGSMMVEFSCEGHETITVGVRIPYIGERLDEVIASYAPIGVWNTKGVDLADVEVDYSGGSSVTVDSVSEPVSVHTFTEQEQLELKRDNLKAELAKRRYEKVDTGYILFDAVHRVSTSLQTQTALAGLNALVSNGVFQPVQWKTTEGTYFTMDQEALKDVTEDVMQYAQEQFDWEKSILRQINGAKTHEEIDAVQF